MTVDPIQPGDLDRMRWAVSEAGDISTSGLIEHAGIPWARGRAALDRLLLLGEVTNSVGHHHGDADLCHCSRGGQALIHWYRNRGGS